MKSYEIKQRLLLSMFALAVLLTACGGGSGEDGTSPVPQSPPIVANNIKLIVGPLKNNEPGFDYINRGLVDGPANKVVLGPPIVDGGTPAAMARDAMGTIYFADGGDQHRVRKLSNGTVSTVAVGAKSDAEYPLTTFQHIRDLAVAPNGDLYVANNAISNLSIPVGSEGNAPGIWRLKPDGCLELVAGIVHFNNGVAQDGKGQEASFSYIRRICSAKDQSVYVDDANKGIRKVSPDGLVETLPLRGNGRGMLECGLNNEVYGLYSLDNDANIRYRLNLATGEAYGAAPSKPRLDGFRPGYILSDGWMLWIAPAADSLNNIYAANLNQVDDNSLALFNISASDPDLSASPPLLPQPRNVIGVSGRGGLIRTEFSIIQFDF